MVVMLQSVTGGTARVGLRTRPTAKQLSAMVERDFQAADRNQDGVVTEKELLAWYVMGGKGEGCVVPAGGWVHRSLLLSLSWAAGCSPTSTRSSL